MHILIGELDEWVPAQACYDLVNLMKDNKINIDIDIYKDAHHSFDRKTELKVAQNGYKFTDCRFKLRNDGAVLMNFLNIPMTNPFLQKWVLLCVLEEILYLEDIKSPAENRLNFQKIL